MPFSVFINRRHKGGGVSVATDLTMTAKHVSTRNATGCKHVYVMCGIMRMCFKTPAGARDFWEPVLVEKVPSTSSRDSNRTEHGPSLCMTT
jgi:hypothetical protein